MSTASLEININATTRDIGFAIRDHLAARNVDVLRPDDTEGLEAAAGRLYIEAVDASDPDNLLVHGENGQRFRVRIFAA